MREAGHPQGLDHAIQKSDAQKRGVSLQTRLGQSTNAKEAMIERALAKMSKAPSTTQQHKEPIVEDHSFPNTLKRGLAAAIVGLTGLYSPANAQTEVASVPAEAPLYDITGPENRCGELDTLPSRVGPPDTQIVFSSELPGFSVGRKDNTGNLVVLGNVPPNPNHIPRSAGTTQLWFVTDGDGNCVWAGYPTEEPAKVEVRNITQAGEATVPAEVPVEGKEKPIVEEELLPESKFIDVTALPGWPSRSPEVFTRLPDGSVQVASPDTSSEMRLLNRIDSIEIGDGLELWVKMNAVSKADPSSSRTSQIILFDNQLATEMGLGGPVELHIGFDRNGYLTLAMLDLNQEDWAQRLKYFVTAQHGKKLMSDELRIKILNDSEDKTLYIFDGVTDTLLIGDFKPPTPVLGNNLNVGFYPQAGDRNGVILTVNALKIRSLTEDLA